MEQQQVHRGPVKNVSAGLVVLAMIVAALAMWTVVPLTWVYIGSKASSSQTPSMGPYMLVLVGIIMSILLLGWVLGKLNTLYIRITGTHKIGPVRPAWMKSMRDSSDVSAGGPTVLEVVIVSSVALAVVAMSFWFFVLAGSPLPNQ